MKGNIRFAIVPYCFDGEWYEKLEIHGRHGDQLATIYPRDDDTIEIRSHSWTPTTVETIEAHPNSCTHITFEPHPRHNRIIPEPPRKRRPKLQSDWLIELTEP